MYTLGKEINFEMRNIFLVWLISDVHLGRGNQLKRNWLKNTKNCLAWLISDVQLVKRNQLCNEEYFSGLINHRLCTWGEEIICIMRNIFLAWLISDVHLRRRNGRQSSWRRVSNCCGPLIDCYKRISNTNTKYLQKKC